MSEGGNKKTIKINPELFKTSGSSDKTRKNREKKPRPSIPITLNESSLRKQFLNRIKEHKNREKNDLDVSVKTIGGNATIQSNSNNVPNKQVDELYESMNYLSLLAKKEKETKSEKRAAASSVPTPKTTTTNHSNHTSNINPNHNKTLKNTNYSSYSNSYDNSSIQHVELELPNELKEPVFIKPPEPNVPPMQLNKPLVQTDVPYGCLKGGSKPTFRSWNNTIKNHTTPSQNILNVNYSAEPQQFQSPPVYSTPITIDNNASSSKTDREKKLDLLRKKLKEQEQKEQERKILEQNLPAYAVASAPSLETIIGDGITKPSVQTSKTSDKPSDENNGKKNVENNEPNKRLIKKTIRKRYTLGKNNIYRKVGILIKDNNTRKKIINGHKELKKKPINDVKKYLIEHGLLKIGSNAPNNVIRKTYESAMLTGEVTNQNKDILLHNLMNETKELF